jgi:hypothetical protein
MIRTILPRAAGGLTFLLLLPPVAAEGGQMPPPADEPRYSVTCQVPDDEKARVYRLSSPGGQASWEIAVRSTETRDAWVRLDLPGAEPRVGGPDVDLDYRTANGGIIVKLEARDGEASLDVYVSYELEVNIHPDLSPQVDLLNSDGRLVGLTCTTAGSAD